MVTIKVNMSECIKKVATRGRITSKEAQDLLQEVADKGDFLRKQTGDPDAFLKVAADYRKGFEEAIKRQRQLAIKGAVARKRGLEITLGGPEWVKGGDVKEAAKRLRGISVGENGIAKDSAQSQENSTLQKGIAVADFAMRKAGVMKYSRSPKALVDVAKAMLDLKTGKPVTGGPAKSFAQIALNTLEGIRKELLSRGVEVHDAMDRVFRTVWDPILIKSGGLWQKKALNDAEAAQRFYEIMDPRFDPIDPLVPKEGRSMDQERKVFWQKTYNAIVSGKHGDPQILNLGPEYEGTSNIMRRLEDSRTIRPRSGQAWAEAMGYYGAQQTPAEFLYHTIRSYAKDIALLDHGGPNYAANMRFIRDSAVEAMKKANDASAALWFQHILSGTPTEILKGRPGLDQILAAIGATPKTPVNYLRNHIIESILQSAHLIFLQSLGQTHFFGTISPWMTQARFAGINPFKALGNILVAQIPDTLKGVERDRLLSELGAWRDGLVVSNPLHHGYNVPGVISYLNSKLMTANMFRYIIRHFKNGWLSMLAHHLSNEAALPFDQINRSLREQLSLYGIDRNKWELIREMNHMVGPAGRKYVTPDAALSIPDAKVVAMIGPASPEAIMSYKEEIAHQLFMYFNTTANHTVVTPGPREAALMHGTSNASSLNAFQSQFLAWPIAAMHQNFAKTVTESLSKKKAVWGLGVSLVLSAFAGYMNLQALRLERNEGLEEPDSIGGWADLVARSVAKGGFLGLAGDYLLGTSMSHGFGGPVGKSVIEAAKIGKEFMTGDKNAFPDFIHWAQPKIPFANLFYMKASMDYLVWYHFFEAMQPGWWDRYNANAMSRGDGSYAGYMPGAPIPFNPLTPITGSHLR